MEQHLLAATPGVTTAMTATFPCRAQQFLSPALKENAWIRCKTEVTAKFEFVPVQEALQRYIIYTRIDTFVLEKGGWGYLLTGCGTQNA